MCLERTLPGRISLSLLAIYCQVVGLYHIFVRERSWFIKQNDFLENTKIDFHFFFQKMQNPIAAGVLLLALCQSWFPQCSANQNAHKIGESSTEFGLDLYKELIKDTAVQNLFMSPVSIMAAMSMTLLGARGR